MRTQSPFKILTLSTIIAVLAAPACDDSITFEEDSCEGEELTFADENLKQAVHNAVERTILCPARLSRLKILHANNYGITDLEGIQALTSLTELDLGQNEIIDLTPLQELSSLESLYLSLNHLNDLTPLSELSSLTELYVEVNQVKDLSPLAELSSLRWLAAGSNEIEDLSPLSDLTSLQEVFLSNNLVTDLSPLVANSGIGDGDYIDLRENPIDPTAQAANLQKLKNRGACVVGSTWTSPPCP